MASALYFHGFASSPNSEKVRSFRALLSPDIELTTPDLNVPRGDHGLTAHVEMMAQAIHHACK